MPEIDVLTGEDGLVVNVVDVLFKPAPSTVSLTGNMLMQEFGLSRRRVIQSVVKSPGTLLCGSCGALVIAPARSDYRCAQGDVCHSWICDECNATTHSIVTMTQRRAERSTSRQLVSAFGNRS